MPYSLTDTLLYFFIYSFCGWLMETILCSVQERRFINRGFLNGPLCPIYGCGVTLIMIFLLSAQSGHCAAGRVHCRGGVGVRCGVYYLLADGKAVSRTLVGLFPL